MKNEQKRLLILLVVLTIAATYWLYERQKGSYWRPKTPPQAAVKPIEMSLTPPAAIQQRLSAEPVSTPEVKVERTWGRDPFQPPAGIKMVKKPVDHEQEKKLGPLPKVTCIFIKGSQKIAIISDTNCFEGDMVGDEKIVKILPDRVILEKGQAQRETLLEGGNILIVKEVK